jgi:hypothetical protein
MHKDYVMSRELAGDYASLASPAAGDGANTAAAAAAEAAVAPRVGIMFGRESSGLTNEEVAMAGKIVVVDSDPEFAVLNLGQAVMVCCYELYPLLRSCGAAAAAAVAAVAEVAPAAPKAATSDSSTSSSGSRVFVAAAGGHSGGGGRLGGGASGSDTESDSEARGRGAGLSGSSGGDVSDDVTGGSMDRFDRGSLRGSGGSISDGLGFSFSSDEFVFINRASFSSADGEETAGSSGSSSSSGSRTNLDAFGNGSSAGSSRDGGAEEAAGASGSPFRPELANLQELATVGQAESFLERLFTELEAAGRDGCNQPTAVS